MTYTTRFTLRRRLLGAAALAPLALAAGLAAPGDATAQPVMKMASATINDVQHEWQKVFKAGVEKRLGPEALTIELYPASQLGAIPRMVEGTLFGTIESFITPTAFLTGTESTLQVFEAPGLFESPEHVGRVIHDPDYRDHIETMALDKGLRIVGAIFNSPTLVLTREPVATLDGFDGLKIRTFATPLQTEPMSALGASPTPMALSDVVPALQSGNIDGMVAGMPILTAFKYWDVAQYVTDLGFSQLVSVNVVNEQWFQGLPEDVRQVILEEGREAEQAVLSWGIENVERANATWTENGGEILDLSEDEHDRMMDMFAEIGADILSQDDAVAAEYDRLVEVVEAKR